MSHNGSTPRIHVAGLWGGSGKSRVTLEHDRSMCRRGSEAIYCRAADRRLRAQESDPDSWCRGTPGFQNGRARNGAGE